MADFKISRSAGLTSRSSLLRAVVYMNVLAGWKHESGAWLVIAECPSFPQTMNVHWRATDHYSESCLEFVDSFTDDESKDAWARALKSAEIAWEAGPSTALEDKARASDAKWKNKLSEAGERGGRKSGETRSAIAEA